jgi:hypothetical protein
MRISIHPSKLDKVLLNRLPSLGTCRAEAMTLELTINWAVEACPQED